MAIPRAIGAALVRLAARDAWRGDVLQLGPQRVYLTERELGGRGWRFADGEVFFQALGFAAVESCDVVPEAGASFVADLNEPIDPARAACYDAVVDGGTMEHVFDVPQVLRNVHALLRAGGRVVHVAPCSNYLDHGYYQFGPQLLRDWYSLNGWTIEHEEVFVHRRRWARSRWRSMPYDQHQLAARSMGGFGRRLVIFLFVAAKADGATAHLVPQQSLPAPALARRTGATADVLDRLRAIAWPLVPLPFAGRRRRNR